MFMKVDLPLPEAPTTARNVPFAMSRFTPRRAWTVTSPTTNDFFRSTIWTRRRSPGAAGPAPATSATSAPLRLRRERVGRARRGPWARTARARRRVADAGDDLRALVEPAHDL